MGRENGESMSKRARMKQVFKVMPLLLAYMAWCSWFNYFSGDPYNAFVETMVECPMPVPDANGTCPTGSEYRKGLVTGGGTCVPVPRHDPDWSLSDKCADKPLVIKRSTDLNGMNQWVGAGLSLSAVFLGGATIDSIGRRPVMLMALYINVVVKALLFASCFMPWNYFVATLFAQNAIVIMSLSPQTPAMNSMVGDLSRGDEALRGECYAWMEIVNHIADVVAFLAGYPVLALHLGNYQGFWFILMSVALIAAVVFTCVLKETKPERQAVDSESGDDSTGAETEESGVTCCSAVATSCGAFTSAVRDPYLGQFLVIWALVSLACQGSQGLAQQYAQTALHVSQENASLCRALWHVTLTVGSALSAPLIRRFGAVYTMALGLGLISAAWAICGFGPLIDVEEVQVFCFWVVALGFGGVAYGMVTPCFNTILTGRVSSDLMGKIFAASIIVNTLVGLSASPLWPWVLFDPFVKGLRTTLMWLVSAAIFFVMLVWLVILEICQEGRKPMTSEYDETGSEAGSVATNPEAMYGVSIE